MTLVICDTDFLIKIASGPLPKVDWALLSTENEFCTIPEVARELKGLLNADNSILRKRAKMALGIIGKDGTKPVRFISTKSEAKASAETDFALFDFAAKSREKCLIATLDRSLLSRLERNHLPYMTLSSGRVLKFR